MKIAKLVLPLMMLATIIGNSVKAQNFAVKTNIPAWFTTHLNVGMEMAISRQLSVELPLYLNPWHYSHKLNAMYAVAQPGARYWFYECFTGPFVGAQAGIGGGELTYHNQDAQGYMLSAGASFGYAWLLSPRWNLEAEAGLGYYWCSYKARATGNNKWNAQRSYRNFWFPTRLGINIVYLF